MHAPRLRLRPDESTALKPLGKQAQSVAGAPQQLDAITAFTAKHKYVATEWIIF